MTIVVLSIGVNCSGKTYYGNKLLKTLPNSININYDDIKNQLKTEDEKLINTVIEGNLKNYISNNFDFIYYDVPCYTYSSRRRLINFLKENYCKVWGIVFDIPLNVCIMRNTELKKVNTQLLEKMYEIFKNEMPDYSEGFDRIIHIK